MSIVIYQDIDINMYLYFYVCVSVYTERKNLKQSWPKYQVIFLSDISELLEHIW